LKKSFDIDNSDRDRQGPFVDEEKKLYDVIGR
jgi:hypothetical protein